MRRWVVFAFGWTAVAAPLSAQRPLPIEELMRRAVADSNDPEAHYRLAMGYWQKKKWDEADRSLRQAVSLSASFAEAWLALSVLAFERGERYWRRLGEQHGQGAVDSALSQARLFQQRAFLSNPLMDLAMLGRFKASSRVRTSIGLEVVLWWAGDFEKGVNALRESRNEEAYLRFEKILNDRRTGGTRGAAPWFILWHHGIAAARLGRFVESIADFANLTGRARAQESRDPAPAEALSAALMQLTGAVFSDEGLEAQTNEFRYVLGMMYFLAGKLGQAIAVFQRVLEFDVGVYQAHVQLARIYEARQMWPEAIAARRSAVATNPDDHSLLIDLGSTLMRAGQLEEALDVLEQAAEQGPRDPRAPYTIALAATLHKDYPTARAAFARYLSLAPSNDSYQIGEARRRLAELPAEIP